MNVKQQVLLQTGQTESQLIFFRQNPQFKGKGTQRNDSKHLPSNSSQHKGSVPDVAEDPTQDNSVQPEKLSATTVRRRGTTAHNAFASQLRREVVTPMESDAVDHYDMAFLNVIGTDQATTWNCTVLVNGHEVPFKVDTGAEITVISEDLWTSLGMSELKTPTKKLHGPDSKPLKVRGELHATLQYRGRQCTQPIFVVKHLHTIIVNMINFKQLNTNDLSFTPAVAILC